MKSWVSEDWANHFLNRATPGSTVKILFGMHGVQQASSVNQLLHNKKTVLITFVKVLEAEYNQSTWLSINLLKIMFENYSKKLLMKTLKLKSKKRYLLQKGEFHQLSGLLTLWKNVKSNQTMIKHSFLKCELSNNLDGTKDNQIKIKGNCGLHNAFQREGAYSSQG